MSPGTNPETPGRRLAQLAALDVGVLTSIPDKRRSAFAAIGITTVLDLVTHYPRKYLDRTRRADLADLAVGDEAVIFATVTRVDARRTRQGKALVEVTVDDGTGSLRATFFNQAWRKHQLRTGTSVLLFGTVTEYRGQRQLTNPAVDVVAEVDDDAHGKLLRVIPVYPASAKAQVSSVELARAVEEALTRAGTFADPLPDAVRESLGLLDRNRAMHAIHQPSSLDDAAPARRRLAFDELLRLQLALVLRRQVATMVARGISHRVEPNALEAPDTLVARFISGLAFALTDAQRRVLEEVATDMAAPLPMRRLLQGDVGSGKTVIAVAAMLIAVEGGHQGALLVPTEVLAEQHYNAIVDMVAGLEVDDQTALSQRRPLRVARLVGRATQGARQCVVEGLRAGEVDIVVGTHALLGDAVGFNSLGVVIIDEQHRFGVEQRAHLAERGGDDVPDADQLVMTATPIPRTAAMVVFGDLDLSVLDELPPGRTPVVTTWAQSVLEREGAYGAVRAAVARGEQAYVVCPLVGESEKSEAKAVTEEFERLAAGELRGLGLGLLHGQLSSDERIRVMAEFRRGDLDVLIATTVIEVGVDVPNATVMVIEDAARFGIAQLHQLRGRVGRGHKPSACFLLGEASTPEGNARLAAMVESSDGFALAEVDLQIRGSGTIFGARQQGRTDLKLASLKDDLDLVTQARTTATSLLGSGQLLSDLPLLGEELRLFLDDDEADFLFKT